MNKIIGERIRKLREERNLKQWQIAELIDRSVRSYQNVEYGKADLLLNEAIIISKYYNISLDFLAGIELMPSEKAVIYKKQLDALNRQGKKDLFAGERKTSRKEVAEKNNTSEPQVRKLVRLNYLIDRLKEMVDRKDLAIITAVELSYLSIESQKIIEKIIKEEKLQITQQLAKALKKAEKI